MKLLPVLLLLGLLVSPALGFEVLVNKTGSNFIWWWWEDERDVNLTRTIYVDNELVVNNGTLTHYILSDLNSNEEHVIKVDVWNWSTKTLNATGTLVSKTREQDVWLPLYIALALLIVGWFTIPLLIFVGIIPAFYGLAIAFQVSQQSYIVYLYAFMSIFMILAAGMRTWYGR